ncbi:CotD family spore coat protein [Priestia megaterium]|uniref:CotD family spore coat protein n=1 Tax=Priestia megaterium TaxID=1404 RepID=UPI0030C8F002
MGKEKKDYEKCSIKKKKYSCSIKKNNKTEEVITDPTETVVNYTTTTHTIKRIHPTHVKNVHKDVYKYEDYYPVTESYENETSTEYYDCGSDLCNPCCKKEKRHKKEKRCKKNK